MPPLNESKIPDIQTTVSNTDLSCWSFNPSLIFFSPSACWVSEIWAACSSFSIPSPLSYLKKGKRRKKRLLIYNKSLDGSIPEGLRSCLECVREGHWPTEQLVVCALQLLMLVSHCLQTPVVFQELLAVRFQPLHLQQLIIQLRLQILFPPLGVFQQRS